MPRLEAETMSVCDGGAATTHSTLRLAWTAASQSRWSNLTGNRGGVLALANAFLAAGGLLLWRAVSAAVCLPSWPASQHGHTLSLSVAAGLATLLKKAAVAVSCH